MIDLHIHLARLPHKEQLTQLLLDRNYDFIAIACEPWEWKEVSLLKKEFSSGLKPFKAAYGIHPMIATQATDDMFTKLRALVKEDKRAMVGEAGIDKRYPGYEDGTQDRVFLEQAKIALELQRDLQIHCVGDYTRVLRLLKEVGYESDALTDRAQDPQSNRKLSRPIFHRFGGNLSVVKKALPYGALFSLHTDSFRKKSTAAAIPLIPESNVFFETDADETFAQRIVDRNVATSSATTDPGTESGMTSSKESGMTSSAESVILTLAEGKDPVQYTPEECASELEKRLESVRLAYAKCRE
jgi:TatD DNase family protein